MKLITRFELAARGMGELHTLRREAYGALARSAPGTPERRASLATLENIDAELAFRLTL
jgi:hypothetical protein